MPSVFNESTKISDEDVQRITGAIDKQLREDFDPEYERTPWGWSFNDPSKYIRMVYVDYDKDVPGALAYHTSDKGRPVLFTLVGTILDAGGSILDGDWSVSCAASHEAIEAKLDPRCQLGALNVKDGFEYWYEGSDACQAFAYVIDGVAVSDFVTKSWFDADDPTGPYDFLNKLTAPFEIGAGGYQVRWKPGSEDQIHAIGDKVVRTRGEVIGTVPPWHGFRAMERLNWREV